MNSILKPSYTILKSTYKTRKIWRFHKKCRKMFVVFKSYNDYYIDLFETRIFCKIRSSFVICVWNRCLDNRQPRDKDNKEHSQSKSKSNQNQNHIAKKNLSPILKGLFTSSSSSIFLNYLINSFDNAHGKDLMQKWFVFIFLTGRKRKDESLDCSFKHLIFIGRKNPWTVPLRCPLRIVQVSLDCSFNHLLWAGRRCPTSRRSW